MKQDSKTVKISIRRSIRGSEETRIDVFEVPFEEKMSIFNALEYIHSYLDSSLAFYTSCRIGKCMGCMVTVNHKRRLACTTLIDGDVLIEPDGKYPLIRDLVVDMGNF